MHRISIEDAADLDRVEPIHRRRKNRVCAHCSNTESKRFRKREQARTRIALGQASKRDRGCVSKVCYATEHEAAVAARTCSRVFHATYAVYRCPFCGRWHLTSKGCTHER